MKTDTSKMWNVARVILVLSCVFCAIALWRFMKWRQRDHEATANEELGRELSAMISLLESNRDGEFIIRYGDPELVATLSTKQRLDAFGERFRAGGKKDGLLSALVRVQNMQPVRRRDGLAVFVVAGFDRELCFRRVDGRWRLMNK